MTGGLVMLAELAAAVDVLRPVLAAPDPVDASVCHGCAGPVDLLVTAATALDAPVHLAAARRAGSALRHRAWQLGAYGSGLGPGARHPSLLYGLAGTGLVLLRLHDPAAGPSVTVPTLQQDGRAPPTGRLTFSDPPFGPST